MSITHASIVPLIGGETIAMENIFKTRPEYFLTFDGFQANEEHLRNYYNNEMKRIIKNVYTPSSTVRFPPRILM